MSSQQSKPDQHRFSGPELGDLLDRVVTEHGEEAAIAAVNRIRSGGVAGFFCREEFEVIVDPAAGATPNPEPEPDPHPDDETIAEAIGHPSADRPPARLAYRPPDAPSAEEWIASAESADFEDLDPAPAPSPDAGDAVRSVAAPTVDAEANADVDADLDAGVDPGPVFGGPVAPGVEPGDDRFLALLERRLDEAATAESDLQLRRSRSAWPERPIDEQPLTPVAPAPNLLSPSAAPAPVAAEAEVGRAARSAPEGPRPPFWHRLDLVRGELGSFLPAGSPRTAVVGPLPLATAVVSRLQAAPALASAPVIALTNRAGIVSEPSWRLERTGDRLVRALEETDGPAIVVIDVPVQQPHWMASLRRRLRTVGVGLFRYAVDGQPTGAELERYRQGADVPYAIDLTSRVDPFRVVELVAGRHPIVSVAGADLGPELLLALRRHVGSVVAPAGSVNHG